VPEIFCCGRRESEGDTPLPVRAEVQGKLEIGSDPFQMFLGIGKFATAKSWTGHGFVIASRTEHEEVLDRNASAAPADLPDISSDQPQSQPARRRAATLGETTVEGNTLDRRGGARHAKEFCLEPAVVELPPFVVRLSGKFGKMFEARERKMLRTMIIADNADNVNPDIRVWKSEIETGESDD